MLRLMYLVHTVLNGGAKQTGVTKTSKWILPCTLLCLFGTASASNEHAAPTLESAHVVSCLGYLICFSACVAVTIPVIKILLFAVRFFFVTCVFAATLVCEKYVYAQLSFLALAGQLASCNASLLVIRSWSRLPFEMCLREHVAMYCL